MSDAVLEEVYATLPGIACKGLCARSCGPVMSTPAEAKRAGAAVTHLRDDVVLWNTPDRKLRCQKLRNGRCTIYEVRPAICRLWGLVEGKPCLWGCEPERMLTDAEAAAFLDAVRIASRAEQPEAIDPSRKDR